VDEFPNFLKDLRLFIEVISKCAPLPQLRTAPAIAELEPSLPARQSRGFGDGAIRSFSSPQKNHCVEHKFCGFISEPPQGTLTRDRQ